METTIFDMLLGLRQFEVGKNVNQAAPNVSQEPKTETCAGENTDIRFLKATIKLHSHMLLFFFFQYIRQRERERVMSPNITQIDFLLRLAECIGIVTKMKQERIVLIYTPVKKCT